MTLPVYVVTSGRYHWALRGFAYLFGVYWSQLQPVIVATDTRPPFTLPPNFRQVTVSNGRALPKDRWSDGVIHLLQQEPASHFALMLEDYWLTRTVDHVGIASLADYARGHPDILRLDLTDDRQYNGDARPAGAWGHYDLVETPGSSPYQLSLQAAIWNRELLLSVLRPGMTPWEVELHLSPSLHDRTDLRVIGTRQCPVRYINVFKGGDSGTLLNLDGLPDEHREVMQRLGLLSRG